MDMQQLAKTLANIEIENLETIASKINAPDQETYALDFAGEIVQQKLDNSGFSYEEMDGHFPYLLTDQNVVVDYSPGVMVPDKRKNPATKYAQKIRKEINGYDGIIQFLPFQMNGNKLRSSLEKELNVGFVNLPYDDKSIERRYLTYSK